MEALKERSLMQHGGTPELNIGNNQLQILLHILMSCKKAFSFNGSNIVVQLKGWTGLYPAKFNITESDTYESSENILGFIKEKLPSEELSKGVIHLAKLAIELNVQHQGINWTPTEPNILKVNNRHSYSIDENNKNINISSENMRGDVLEKQVAIADERYVEADASIEHKLKKAVEEAIRITSSKLVAMGEAQQLLSRGDRGVTESRKTLQEIEEEAVKAAEVLRKRKAEYIKALEREREVAGARESEIRTNIGEHKSRIDELKRERTELLNTLDTLGKGYKGCLNAHSTRNKEECEENACVWDGDNCNNSWKASWFTSSNEQYVSAQRKIRDLDISIAESIRLDELAEQELQNHMGNSRIREHNLKIKYGFSPYTYDV
jgi:hypothetical protein